MPVKSSARSLARRRAQPAAAAPTSTSSGHSCCPRGWACAPHRAVAQSVGSWVQESPWSHSASALRPPGPESTGPFLAPGQTQRRGKTVRATWPAHWLTPLSTSPPSRHPRLLALDLPLGSPRSWSVFPTKHACGPHFLLAGEAGPVGWPWRGGQGHDGSILRVLLEKAKVFCIHSGSSKPLFKARVGGSSLGPHPSPPAWSSQQGSEEGRQSQGPCSAEW